MAYDAKPPYDEAAKLTARLRGLKSREKITYHAGDVAFDRVKYPEVGQVADVAAKLAEEGRVRLVKKPVLSTPEGRRALAPKNPSPPPKDAKKKKPYQPKPKPGDFEYIAEGL